MSRSEAAGLSRALSMTHCPSAIELPPRYLLAGGERRPTSPAWLRKPQWEQSLPGLKRGCSGWLERYRFAPRVPCSPSALGMPNNGLRSSRHGLAACGACGRILERQDGWLRGSRRTPLGVMRPIFEASGTLITVIVDSLDPVFVGPHELQGSLSVFVVVRIAFVHSDSFDRRVGAAPRYAFGPTEADSWRGPKADQLLWQHIRQPADQALRTRASMAGIPNWHPRRMRHDFAHHR